MKLPQFSTPRFWFIALLAGLPALLSAQTPAAPASPTPAPLTAASAPSPASSSTPVITITTPPASQLALTGTNVHFTAVATGAKDLNFTWKKDGKAIPGADTFLEKNSELVLKNAQLSDAGNYTVTVWNPGSGQQNLISRSSEVTSPVATLTMVPPATAQPPALPEIPDAVFNIMDYGAVADGVTDDTDAIRKTIAACQAAGGGIVKFPAAAKPYLAGPFTVGNKMDLQIDSGATLQLLPFAATGDTPAFPRGSRSFISGSNRLEDFAITGQGTIDGQGAAWWAAGGARPYLIRLSGCDRVLVSGITMINSPMFHLAANGSNITAVGLTIRAPGNSPNTDAIDPGGSHILIQNCNLSIGDDNVAVKAGGIFCSDITVANCTIGQGHGISVGGQSNAGLDGMLVKDCTFNGTVTGLRLKADPTQGGLVQNITYNNLTMTNVQYPIVFYSYYKSVGNPGVVSGSNHTTPAKVNQWNAQPPNSLHSRTLSGWRNITVNNLTATGIVGYNIIWGLPLPDYLIANVTLNNVRFSGGPGLEIYDATNVQVTGNSDVGNLTTGNSLAIISQPQSQAVAEGGNVTFTVGVAGASGVKGTAPKFQWNFNGKPLADGTKEDGTTISGATTAALTLNLAVTSSKSVDTFYNPQGNYTVTVSNSLDGYDLTADALAPDSIPVSTTSSPATLTVK